MAPGTTADFEDSNIPQLVSKQQSNGHNAKPPPKSLLSRPEAVPVLASLDLASLPLDTLCKFSVSITPSALGSIDVPIFAYRSSNPGPVIGITCAIHGNEVNGIPVIQKLFADIEQGLNADSVSSPVQDALKVECGTIIGIPVVNVPGFLASIRCFDDESKQDLNRLMPGKVDGAAPQQYAHKIFHSIVTHFDYLIDLHTASLGRRNSLYIRADMNHPVIGELARLMKPQVLVHVSTAGSLRGCAQARGIHALTVEIGSASVFQTPFILATYVGIRRVIASIGISGAYGPREIPDMSSSMDINDTVICTRSFWIFSQAGGILKVFKDIAQRVRPGELLAEIQSIFGEPLERIYAPDYDTVVVGVEGNPVAKGGNRVLHLGVVGNDFAVVANDGHL